MVTHNDKLEVFERFEIDKNLPKYKVGESVELKSSQVSGIAISDGLAVPSEDWSMGNVISWNTATGTSGLNTYIIGNTDSTPKKESLISRLFKKWRTKREEKQKQKEAVQLERKKAMTIIEFFTSLATNLNELKTLTDIAIHYETAINNAQKAGQVSLVEQLKGRLTAAKSEAQLVAYGLNLYLTEQQVVDFYRKTDRDNKLKLTWMKNFIKPIPTKILDVKEKLDLTFVFDNYVILHYDPNNDATNLTKEEKEKRDKDPILFGVMENSRRLYYVGDWIDDYCNLTLDVVLETLNEKAHEINNENVKTFIDRGREKIIIKEPIMISEHKSKPSKKRKK